MPGRRTFLGSVASTVTVGAAGCVALSPNDDARRFDTAFTDWLGASLLDRGDSIDVVAYEPAVMATIDGLEWPSTLRDWTTDDLALESFDSVFLVNWLNTNQWLLLAAGDFDRETGLQWMETQEGIELAPAGEFREFDVYSEPGGAITAGFYDDLGLAASDRTTFERAIAAAAGENERLVDTHEDFEVLASHLAELPYLQLRYTDTIAGRIGFGYDFGSPTTDFRIVDVRIDEAAARARDGRWVDFQSGTDATDTTVVVEGKVIFVSGTIATDGLEFPVWNLTSDEL